MIVNKLKNQSNAIFVFFCITLTIFASHFSFNFPFSIYHQHIGQTDLLLIQSQIQSIIQVGPFDKTFNLGYPFGFTQWLNPEFSILQSILTYFFQFIPNITNFGILSLINFISILFNSISFLLVLNLLSKNIFFKIFGIFNGTLLPYVLLSFDHPHVIPFFIWNLVIYFYIKIQRNQYSLQDNFLLILSLLYTPLFWINILLFVFFILFILHFIAKKLKLINPLDQRIIFKLFSYLFVTFILNFILFIFHSSLNGENGRTPWQSDIFAGKFTDLLLSSAFIRSFLSENSPFLNLSTMDSSQNLIGLSLILVVLISFPFIFLSSYLIKLKPEEKFMILLLQLLFFAFFVGGLGNFQSALFLIFGEASPIRAWGRLLIVIPFISLFFLISYFEQRIKSKYLNFIGIALILIFIFDFSKLKLEDKYESNYNNLEETGAVSFIQKSLSPCPILQLPIDTYFIPQSAQDRGFRYYWNGKIPYILLPNFKWTSSIYVGSPGWESRLNIPTEINKNNIKNLEHEYCAILFDSNFSQYQIDRKASLSGDQIIWPGLLLNKEIKPNYEDTRFKVILLDNR